MTKHAYRVRVTGELLGVWRQAGELVELTADQARNMVAPFGSELEPADLSFVPAGKFAELTVTRSPRRRRRSRDGG